MPRGAPDFYTRVHITSTPHYSSKEKAKLENHYTEFSTSESGVQEICKVKVKSDYILFLTDVVTTSDVDLIIGIGWWDGETQADVLKFRVGAGTTWDKGFVTPLKIPGAEKSWLRVWGDFPTGGGTVPISLSYWAESTVFAPAYYGTSHYNECVYG